MCSQSKERISSGHFNFNQCNIDYKSAPHNTCRSNRSKFGQFVCECGCIYIKKNRCATTCQPQRQVIAKSNCYCIMSLCTASSKINCPAYLSSILHLLSSPCYCIPSTVLTCFLILCTSRDLKTQTNPASLVTPAPISLFPGMMAEEQPYTGTMSPGI